MGISFNELIKGKVLPDVTHTQQLNLEELRRRVTIVLNAYDQWLGRHWPVVVTSGLRTMQEHLRIYAAKGILDPTKIPMRSAHLEGMAVDISDPGHAFKRWLQNTPEGIAVMEQADLYGEEDEKAARTHLQTRPFNSYKPGGTRWFRP